MTPDMRITNTNLRDTTTTSTRNHDFELGWILLTLINSDSTHLFAAADVQFEHNICRFVIHGDCAHVHSPVMVVDVPSLLLIRD